MLPNKVIPSRESVFPYLLDILEKIGPAPISVGELMKKSLFGLKSPADFVLALDVLFALGKIGWEESRKGVLYVG